MRKENVKEKGTLLFLVVAIITVIVLTASVLSPVVVASDSVTEKITQEENVKEKEELKKIETNKKEITKKDIKQESGNVKVQDSAKKTATEKKTTASKSNSKKNTSSPVKNQSITSKPNKNNSKPNTTNKPNSNKPVSNPTKIGRVNLKSGVSQARGKTLNNNISTMPSIILKALDITGTKVFLNTSLPNNASGNFDVSKRAINFANSDYSVSRRVVAHEFGHFLDFLYDTGLGAHDSKEFKEIFYSEKNKFVMDGDKSYYTSSRIEYFAQAFSEYICNPSRLQKNTPKTYNFVKKVLSSINDSKIQNAKAVFDIFS